MGQVCLKGYFCTWGLRKEGRKGRKTDQLALDSSPVLKGPWQTGPLSGGSHPLELRLLGKAEGYRGLILWAHTVPIRKEEVCVQELGD